jgi:alpha-D-ribose 1-methylphosphonate 5-triphosphate diphosphatase
VTGTVLTNVRMVLADKVVGGTLCIKNGKIDSISTGRAAGGEDLEGDYLIPGLVELHTDHLESHYHPRPGVEWPAVSAVIAHDAQIASAGITTVFDALRAGSFDPNDYSARNGRTLAKAINAAQKDGQLRAEHFIHLRCELPCADTIEAAERVIGEGSTKLVSVMDHTPGCRQFVSIEKFKEYYLGKKLILPEKIDEYIAEKIELQQLHAVKNKAGVLAIVKTLGLKLASHDDAIPEHVEEAVTDGAAIAEFPTSAPAVEAAHRHGLAVLMGAPNLVRGGSHSGNVSTASVAQDGRLDIMSSDYVPQSLLLAAFALPQMVETISLPQAVGFVSSKPASAAGLSDRGEIANGKRADLVQVHVSNGHPVVRRVWREGRRVL